MIKPQIEGLSLPQITQDSTRETVRLYIQYLTRGHMGSWCGVSDCQRTGRDDGALWDAVWWKVLGAGEARVINSLPLFWPCVGTVCVCVCVYMGPRGSGLSLYGRGPQVNILFKLPHTLYNAIFHSHSLSSGDKAVGSREGWAVLKTYGGTWGLRKQVYLMSSRKSHGIKVAGLISELLRILQGFLWDFRMSKWLLNLQISYYSSVYRKYLEMTNVNSIKCLGIEFDLNFDTLSFLKLVEAQLLWKLLLSVSWPYLW